MAPPGGGMGLRELGPALWVPLGPREARPRVRGLGTKEETVRIVWATGVSLGFSSSSTALCCHEPVFALSEPSFLTGPEPGADPSDSH